MNTKVTLIKKKWSVEEYLDKIRPYLTDIINDLTQSGIWKNHLTIAINFISSKDGNDVENVIHSKIDNLEIMINGQVYDVIKNLFIHLKIDTKKGYNRWESVCLRLGSIIAL